MHLYVYPVEGRSSPILRPGPAKAVGGLCSGGDSSIRCAAGVWENALHWTASYRKERGPTLLESCTSLPLPTIKSRNNYLREQKDRVSPPSQLHTHQTTLAGATGPQITTTTIKPNNNPIMILPFSRGVGGTVGLQNMPMSVGDPCCSRESPGVTVSTGFESRTPRLCGLR